ncbi:hypothetical protein AB0E08_03740 [Streptomyces sp. NPDC048281]|uniref:hypothetical protein n=1 Tax=Streptomyces sp. NPDC048281 TaxID=3154715 RepID=UPI00342CDA3D
MVSESENGQKANGPRRTGAELQRRRDLADAASGVAFSDQSKVTKFRVVIYLCGARNADLSGPLAQAREHAEAFGWDVVAEIEDAEGLNPPAEREGLKLAIGYVEEKTAGAVLTPWRTMISPIADEYDETARRIERWGGFLQVMDSARDHARAGVGQ